MTELKTTSLRDQVLGAFVAVEDNYSIAARRFAAYLKETGQGLGPESVDGFLAELRSGNGRPRKAATVNFYIAALKKRIRYLMDQGADSLDLGKRYLLEKYLSGITLQKKATIAVDEDKIISQRELEALIERTDNPAVKLWIEFLAATGCRVSEMLGLEKADCRKRGDQVTCRIMGKGSKERYVFISSDLYARIREHFHGSKYLLGHGGKHYSREYVSVNIARAAAKHIGRDISAHSLRHSFATQYLEQNPGEGSVKELSTYLGHSDPALTLRLYVHRSMDPRRALSVWNQAAPVALAAAGA